MQAAYFITGLQPIFGTKNARVSTHEIIIKKNLKYVNKNLMPLIFRFPD